MGNGGNGVYINNVSGNTISVNLISGNVLNGVLISAGTGKTQTRTGEMVQGNTVQGNRIGTDVNGATAIGNGQNGVFLNGSPVNTIGGTTSGAGNLISGNLLSGVSFFGAATTGNLLLGNRIGTNAGGTLPVGNMQDGVLLTDAPGNFLGGTEPGSRNIISGNAGDGISLTGAGSTGNLIEGDFIGTNIQGTGPLRNGQDGVAVFDASGDTVGGTVQGARNVISGNDGNGISFTDTPASDIVGNFIGTDVTGTQPVANVADGVLFDDSTSDTVGGTAQGAGNVISGNGQAGVEIRGTTSQNDVVEGNTIGPAVGGESFVTATSTGELGNLYGVYINGSAYNTVGGTNASAQPDLRQQPPRRQRGWRADRWSDELDRGEFHRHRPVRRLPAGERHRGFHQRCGVQHDRRDRPGRRQCDRGLLNLYGVRPGRGRCRHRQRRRDGQPRRGQPHRHRRNW